MRKASHILYMIGYVISVLGVISLIACTIIFFVISGPDYTDTIIQQLKEGKITTDFVGTVEQQAAMIQSTFKTGAIFFLIGTILEVIKTVFGVLANIKKRTAFYITSLVFGALCGDPLFILAPIFGIVANKQDSQTEQIEANY